MQEEFFDEKEAMSPQARIRYQTRKIKDMIIKGYERSARVKNILNEAGIVPTSVHTLADLEMLPVVTREKLIEIQLAEPPYGGFEDPSAPVDRVFISPGPVYEPHLSESDALWARAYFAAGIGPADIALNAFSYHMVAAGLTFHSGLRKVGATVIPSGTSGSDAQVQLIRDLKVTAYTGTPSFLLAIIKKAGEMGYDFRKDFRVKKACLAAEPLLPPVRESFEKDYGIDTYQMYGATEVGDVAYECREKKGWHICEEVIVEIVDPATGRSVPNGQLGEIVVTRFNDVFFLMRFGTGDLSRLIETPCACGRTSFRLDGIAGRVGDAVKVRGLFIAPSQLKALGIKYPHIRMQAIVSRTGYEDVLTVRVEAASPDAGFEDAFRKTFREICTVRIDRLEIVAPGTLAASEPLLKDIRVWPDKCPLKTD
jgi:phenylacetate-CoA ligase